jgi:hypothetical protein
MGGGGPELIDANDNGQIGCNPLLASSGNGDFRARGNKSDLVVMKNRRPLYLPSREPAAPQNSAHGGVNI